MKIFSDYGIVLVLIALCVYFSVATWNEQHPTGAAAAQQLAATIAGQAAGVVVVVRDSRDDAEFARQVVQHLQQRNIAVLGVIKGQPSDARALIEALAAEGRSIDYFACNQHTSTWSVLERAPNARIVRPESYYWPDFLKVENLRNIANQIAVIAILAIGMTLVIITGGIDLSVGSLIALSAVVAAWLIRAAGASFSYTATLESALLIWAGILLAAGAAMKAIAARAGSMGSIWNGVTILSFGGAGLLGLYALAPFLIGPLVRGLQQFGPTPAIMAVCCAVAIALCGGIGFFSGSLVTFFRVPAFIVTLAMMLVASGFAYKISEGESIHQIPESFIWLGRGADILNIPNAVLLMLFLYAVAHIVMTRMAIGRYIYAVGGNAEAARLSGVPVRGVLLLVYTLAGLLAGLGGVIMASQLQSGAPVYGQMYELYVIAAAVVGGASLAGGEGKIISTLIGAFIIAVIQNGMNLTGMEFADQRIVLGLVILGAVLFDTAKRRGTL